MKKLFEQNRRIRYLFAVLIPVILLTLLFFVLTGRHMVSLSVENMMLQTGDSANRISSYMAEVVSNMEDIREVIERTCTTNEEVVALVRATENYGAFGGVYTGDNTGFYVGSTPWDVPDDYDPTTRPWYTDGMNSRDFVFGAPYLDVSEGRMCVSVSARMDAGDDSIVRVIACDLYLDYLDGLVEELVSSSQLSGAVLVTQDESMIVADAPVSHAGETFADSSDFNQRLSAAVSGGETGRQLTLKDAAGTYYVAVWEVPATGWYLVAYEKRGVILHDLYILELIMGAAALAVGLFLIYVMQRYGREVSAVEQQANRAKTEFISRISHDIRTPIGQVLNLAEFARADIDNREKLTEDLDRIDSSGRFLLSLINDVLDVSQIESGLMEMHPEAVSYDRFMTDIRNIMLPLCESKGLTCEVSEPEDVSSLPALYCDEVRLKQITLNLISNAVKYTPAGGSVRFISECRAREDGGVDFGYTITDTGVGMTPEFMEHMFEKFTRDTGNKLRDSAQMGSGLGLYLVRNMVTLMGGTVSYESTQGEGTSVTVRIPLEKAPEDESTRAAGAAAGAGAEGAAGEAPEPERHYRGRVLLAEDNVINTEIARRMLEELGLTVECAADGRAAVDLFAESGEGTYSLIFMDIQMPVMNGYEATRAIRKLDRDDAETIPIIAMTADAFKDAEEESQLSGMSGFITKPLIADRICEVLDGLGLRA